MTDPTPILATAGVFLLAGLVKGVIGLGLPTVAIALLSLFMRPAEAAALLLVPSFVTNLAQMLGPGLGALFIRLLPMLAGIVFGAGLGALFWRGQGGGAALMTLGLLLIAYGLHGLAAPALRCPPRLERLLTLPTGLATGLLTVGTGVFVLPAVPLLQALALDRHRLVQSMGLSFTVSTLALGAGLHGMGELRPAQLVPSSLALAPALAGLWLGTMLRARISATLFRRIFFIGLLAVGAQIALRGAGLP
ncbi:MAG: sulfite exporter TauE/SafE family protein [Alphaproteobacteria bacterium]|nr:sulfite exporter TauE/SafE family protein [Alphaproteobacteria bacterium]